RKLPGTGAGGEIANVVHSQIRYTTAAAERGAREDESVTIVQVGVDEQRAGLHARGPRVRAVSRQSEGAGAPLGQGRRWSAGAHDGSRILRAAVSIEDQSTRTCASQIHAATARQRADAFAHLVQVQQTGTVHRDIGSRGNLSNAHNADDVA